MEKVVVGRSVNKHSNATMDKVKRRQCSYLSTSHCRLPRAASAIQIGIRPEHMSLSAKARFGHL